MEEKDTVTASFLVTRADYADFKAASARACFSQNEITGLHIAGIALVLFGVLLWALYGRAAMGKTIWAALLLLGMVVGLFTDTIQPLFARKKAAAYYNAHKERMIAQTLTFKENVLGIVTDRCEAELPYAFLYRIYEDARVFVFYTGEYETRFLPKRVLSEQDILQIRAYLKTKVKN